MEQIFLGIPENRFSFTLAEGGFGEKQHNNYIKIRKDGVTRNFTVEVQKTIEDMIAQFNQEQNNLEAMTQNSDNVEFIAIANDLKSAHPMKLNLKMTGSYLFNQGIKEFQIKSKYDKDGHLQYPDLKTLKYVQTDPQPQKDKINEQTVGIKLVYQSPDNKQMTHTVKTKLGSTIRDLKKQVKQAFGIDSVQNILLEDQISTVFQNDKKTLAQQGITNDYTVFVRTIEIKACFQEKANIKTVQFLKEGSRVIKIVKERKLQDIRVGDFILSYSQKNNLQQDKVKYVQRLKSNILMQVQTKSGQKIISTSSDQYLTKLGWKRHSVVAKIEQDSEQSRQKLKENDSLIYCQTIQGQPIIKSNIVNKQINTITVTKYKNPITLIHICTQKNHNFIVNGFIVHNMQLLVNFFMENKTFKINASPLDLIQQVKVQIQKEINLNVNEFDLYFAHKQLDNKKSLNDYKIHKGDKLQIKLRNTKQDPKIITLEKLLCIKHNQKVYTISYKANKNKTVNEVIEQVKKNSPKFSCLLYGSRFLKPTDKLSLVQQNENFTKSNKITCVLVESAEKILFYEKILTENWEKSVQELKDPIKREKLIKYFRDQQQNKILNQMIFRFDPTDPIYSDQQELKQLRQVILCFMGLDSYENQMTEYAIRNDSENQKDIKVLEYNLYKRQTYNGFHKRHKPGEALYFKQFFQSLKKNYKQLLAEPITRQTVFFIRSLSGKSLGTVQVHDKIQQEIVFLPFTYFTIDSIVVNDVGFPTCQYIFLSEMETLYDFKDPFILWIDDLPNNSSNKSIINKTKSSIPNIRILKMISTKQAQNWMNQFAWLLNWHNINFKIISDMTRYEVDHKNPIISLNSVADRNKVLKLVEKPEAAIDLIEVICQMLGYTTLVTIFCANQKRAKKKLDERNLQRGANYQEIVVNNSVLIENISNFWKKE